MTQEPAAASTRLPPPMKTRRYRLVAAGLFAAGMIFTLLIWQLSQRAVHTNEAARLDHYAQMLRELIIERIEQHTAALRSMRGFFNASEQVTDSEWHHYIDDLELDRHFKGAAGFSFVRYLPRQQLPAFIASSRRELTADFTVQTSGNHPDLFVIEYIHPLLSNRELLGYDLGQDELRRQALIAAVTANRETMSRRLLLLETDGKPGFLLLLPIFTNDRPIETQEQRWRALRGWAVSAIDIDGLLSGLRTYFNTPLDIEIYDNGEPLREVSRDRGEARRRSQPTPAASAPSEPMPSSHLQFTMADRLWTIDIATPDDFSPPIEHHLPEILLAGGTLLCLFASLLVAAYGKPLEQARMLAEQMTRDLRASEQRFKNLFRNHNAVMLLVAPEDGHILDANPAASRFYGYSEQQLTSMSVNDLNLMPQDALIAARQQVIAGEANTFEFRHKLASGELRDVEVHSSPVDFGGQLALFSIIHNITPRKQAQRQLAESEQKYRVLFDDAAHGAAVADLETGIILACNRKLAQMLGRKIEEVVGQPQSLLYPPEAIIGNLSRSFLFHRDHKVGQLLTDQLLTHDGKRIDVEIKTSRLKINDRDALQSFFYDISERKRTERSLRESEARFRLVFESNPDPVILFRFDTGEIFDVNRAFETYTRISRLEALGHNAGDLGLWVDDNEQRHFWHLLRAEGEVNNCEARFRAMGGLIRTGLFSARQLTLHREPYVLATVRDITTEKAAERSLIEMDRIKSEFISTAAHELRTPLTAIMGYTELLLCPETFGSFSDTQQREFLDQVYERCEALARIIDDLLDISRIESGHPITLNRQPTDLRELLVKVCEFYRRHTDSHHFELDLPDKQVSTLVDIDRQRINQVLENLLSNAIKYSPKGSAIHVATEAGPDGLVVRVSDEGIGMSEEQVERMFDKFYRVDASNTAIGGLGLGMSIAKQIIDEHGGQIWVESRPGAGTRVCFTLPSVANS